MPALGVVWRHQAASLLQRAPARAPRRPTLSPLPRPNPAIRVRNRRFRSTDSKPSENPSSSTTTTTAPQSRRISRILAGASRFMPKRLRDALRDLRSAPLSHVFAFLVLHELTAVLPIFGLTYAFYALDVDVPTNWLVNEDGLRKWTGYFRKKRWFGLEPEDDADDAAREMAVPPPPPIPRNELALELMDEEAGKEMRREHLGVLHGEMKHHIPNGEGKGDAGALADDSASMPSSGEADANWRSRVAAGLWKANPQLKEVVSSPPKAQGLEQAVDTDWPPMDFEATTITVGRKNQLPIVEWPGKSQPKEVTSLPPDLKHASAAENAEQAKKIDKKLYKIPIHLAAAYTITKMLLVPRMALSLWLTPWLARGFVGFRQGLRRKRSWR
ncbi:hypothetical protein F5B21DRAFT_125095 [Xylaria acuta]|nr:hypothetical protein F5B21DRAFT_125095 [Xylaria acuta]